MLKRTWERFESMFKDFDKLHEDIEADVADLGPLPDGVSEQKTVEEEHRPDGTYVRRTVIKRSSVTIIKK